MGEITSRFIFEVILDKQKIQLKRRARKLALQALYQWLLAKNELYEIEAQFRVANNMEKVDVAYFCQLLYGVPEHCQSLENEFAVFLDRPVAGLNPIELTILRMGSYELVYCPEIPYRVVLDESISLAKTFGSQDGFRYVNGVLNNLARKVRTVEIDG